MNGNSTLHDGGGGGGGKAPKRDRGRSGSITEASIMEDTEDRRPSIDKRWSSLTNIWQGTDANNNEESISPFLADSEESPFNRTHNRTPSFTKINNASWTGLSGLVRTESGGVPELGGGGWGGESAELSTSNLSAYASMRGSSNTFGYSYEVGSSFRLSATTDGGGGVSSKVHDAARITDWARCLQLCEADPEAASYKGRDGWTALHHACNRRCPDADVAEALIKAYPGALLDVEDKEWTPLHYACRFKAPKEVVRLLLHMYPEKGAVTVKKLDKWGRTPLYYAVRYDAPAGVVGLLLEVDPSVVLEEDQNEDSPLALVWDSWADKLEGKRILHPFLQAAEDDEFDASASQSTVPGASSSLQKEKERLAQLLKESKKLKKKWNTVNMFLKAAFGYPVDEDDIDRKQQMDGFEEKKDTGKERKWRMLHATAAVKCHPSLFKVAKALYPEQAEEMDENDLRKPSESMGVGESTHQTALHLAAASNTVGEAGRRIVVSLVKMYADAAQVADGIDGSLPLHSIVENRHKPHWLLDGANAIYNTNTRAVRIQDSKGRLPLHRAAASICHWDSDSDDNSSQSIVCNLVEIYPEATSRADANGCLPFHTIAGHAEVWDDQVEAVYNAHPAAARARSGNAFYNRLPIHLAAASPAATRSLVDRLVELNPRGLSQSDRRGKLPLHLACECGKDWEDGGLQAMHDAYAAAVRSSEENARRWTVLHMAAASDRSGEALLRKLLELYPEASTMADTHGRYALHLAAISGKSWLGGLKTLFDAYPEAYSASDKNGMLPFHLVAFRCTLDENEGVADEKSGSVSLVEDSSSLEEDGNNNAARVDVLYHLLRKDPTIVSV